MAVRFVLGLKEPRSALTEGTEAYGSGDFGEEK